jgi:hypothetical protein
MTLKADADKSRWLGIIVMKPAALPVFCGIVSLYILVAGILILPILRLVENHNLAANHSSAATVSADEATQPRNQFIAKVFSANENSASCRRVKIILTDYSFSEVQTKSCMGKVYQFVATRQGQHYLIEFNALTRDFVKVTRILRSNANLASKENFTASNRADHYVEKSIDYLRISNREVSQRR